MLAAVHVQCTNPSEMQKRSIRYIYLFSRPPPVKAMLSALDVDVTDPVVSTQYIITYTTTCMYILILFRLEL
jgi:hypothetical protein